MLAILDESLELAKRFENVMARIDNSMAFDPEWRSSGNMYEGAVGLQLPVGKVFKALDPKTGRRLILIGTDCGTVVIFEHNGRDKTGSKFALAYNADPALDFMLGGSRLSIAQFSLAITDYDIEENIGISLRRLIQQVNRSAQEKNKEEKIIKTPKGIPPSKVLSGFFGWGEST